MGSPTSPFIFAIHSLRPPETSTTSLWTSGEVAAEMVPSGGGWITFPVRALTTNTIPEPTDIFVEFRWLPETPASPLPCVSSSLNSGTTWYAIAGAAPLDWTPVSYTDLLLRVNYLRSDVGTPATGQGALPDSFQLNLWDSPQTDGFASMVVQITDSLHTWLPAPIAAGRHVTVSAWLDGILSPKSEAVKLDVSTGVHDLNDVVGKPPLLQAFPNPFNSETTIVASAPNPIEIFDLLGRSVRTLQASARSSDGTFIFRWDGNDRLGASAASGLYFARQSGRESRLKLILLK